MVTTISCQLDMVKVVSVLVMSYVIVTTSPNSKFRLSGGSSILLIASYVHLNTASTPK